MLPLSLVLAAFTNSMHAARARSGHAPPAASAMASSGSHTSAGRSLMPSGMSREHPVDQVAHGLRPGGEPVTQLVALLLMDALPERLNPLVRRTAAHADDDRAGQDRVRQRAETGDRDSAERRELLYLLIGPSPTQRHMHAERR